MTKNREQRNAVTSMAQIGELPIGRASPGTPTPEGHNMAQVLNAIHDLREQGRVNIEHFLKALKDCTDEIVGLRLEITDVVKNVRAEGRLLRDDLSSVISQHRKAVEHLQQVIVAPTSSGNDGITTEIESLRAAFNGLTTMLGTINRNVMSLINVAEGADISAATKVSIKLPEPDIKAELLKLLANDEIWGATELLSALMDIGGFESVTQSTVSQHARALCKRGYAERPFKGLPAYRITNEGRERLDEIA